MNERVLQKARAALDRYVYLMTQKLNYSTIRSVKVRRFLEKQEVLKKNQTK